MSEEKQTIIAELTAKRDEKIKRIQGDFERELLSAFGLKVGDEVIAKFNWDGGDSKQSYTTGGELSGVIVKENESLLVRSKEKKWKSISKSSGKYGSRSFREWWEFVDNYPETKIANIIFDEL